MLAKLLSAGASLFIAGAAFAQDLQGRDTASNWRNTHHSSHGIWNTICDEREEYGVLKQRCYIRWVDVYADHPKFGALFTFIKPRDGGSGDQHDVMFGPELGTVFLPSGFTITKDGDEIWRMKNAKCLLLANCTLTPEESDAVLEAMFSGNSLEFSFVDPHFRRIDLEWSLESFSEAFDVYTRQWALRSNSQSN